MPVFHCTMFFAQQGKGWVEQLFRGGPSLAASLTALRALADARYSILASGVNLYRVRVSVVGLVRASASVNVSGVPLALLPTAPELGALLRFQAAPLGLYRRSYLLRGLPSAALQQVGGGWDWSPALAGPVSAWLGLLTDGSWLLQAWDRSGPSWPVLDVVPIGSLPPTLVDPSGGQLPPATFSEGLEVLVDGMPMQPTANQDTGQLPTARVGRVNWSSTGQGHSNGINGEHAVFAAQEGVVVLLARPPATGEYVNGGYLQLRRRSFLPIVQIDLQRPAVKACGPAPAGLGKAPGGVSIEAVVSGLITPIIAPIVAGSGAILNQLGPILTPLGNWALNPSPILPPPPPPPGPGPVQFNWRPAGPVTLANLSEVGQWMFSTLSYPDPSGTLNRISIAQVTNLANTYAVFLYGATAELNGGTGVLAAIAAGIHAPTAYLTTASNALEAHVPATANLLLVGYSLGGIIGELLYADPDFSNRVTALVTLAAPLAGVPFINPPIFRFAVNLDPVPWLTPASALIQFFTLPRVLGKFLSPWTYLPINPSYPIPIDNHTKFCLHPRLAAFDVVGQPFPGQGYNPFPMPNFPALELAAATTLPVPG